MLKKVKGIVLGLCIVLFATFLFFIYNGENSVGNNRLPDKESSEELPLNDESKDSATNAGVKAETQALAESEEEQMLEKDSEDFEVLDNEGNLAEEAADRSSLAADLPFTEGDDKICAIAYLGDGDKRETGTNLETFCQKYFKKSSEEIKDSVKVIDNKGSQCYLIIPRYKETILKLNCLEMSESGQIEIKETQQVSAEAVLVYCNPSQAYANTEVMLCYESGTYVLMPRISQIDNRMEPMQVALDLTEETVYK